MIAKVGVFVFVTSWRFPEFVCWGFAPPVQTTGTELPYNYAIKDKEFLPRYVPQIRLAAR